MSRARPGPAGGGRLKAAGPTCTPKSPPALPLLCNGYSTSYYTTITNFTQSQTQGYSPERGGRGKGGQVPGQLQQGGVVPFRQSTSIGQSGFLLQHQEHHEQQSNYK